MKNILVLIHNDDGQEARLQAALDVTRAVKGHLTCLDVAAVVPLIGEASGVAGGALLFEIERESESRNRDTIEPRLASEGVSWDWIDTADFVEPALEKAAALADLIVVNTADDSLPQPDIRGVASGLIALSGKPVLAVPSGAMALQVAGPALIAWDGSREAADALAAAVPLLRLAERVSLLEVDDGSVRVPGEEAAAYLSRHGIHPRIMHRSGEPPADAILGTLRAGAFAWLVMGGFGHSRLTEALFGGVTRRMLRECPVPVLLAH